jgi:hypothetical protein
VLGVSGAAGQVSEGVRERNGPAISMSASFMP